jgi:hypothetical protein
MTALFQARRPSVTISRGPFENPVHGAADRPGSGSVNSIAGINHIAWITHRRILGAFYGIEVLGVEAFADAGAKGQREDSVT